MTFLRARKLGSTIEQRTGRPRPRPAGRGPWARVSSGARRGALLLATLLVACLLPGQVTSSVAAADVTSAKWRPKVPSTRTTTTTTTATSGTAGDPCGTRIRKATGGYWSCTFAEPFSGTALDRTKWVVQDTARTGFRMGETCFSDDGSNIRVRDGELTLSVTESETPFTCEPRPAAFRPATAARTSPPGATSHRPGAGSRPGCSSTGRSRRACTAGSG